MPMTPFIGVRISWLMLARNSLLARLAASAASRGVGEQPAGAGDRAAGDERDDAGDRQRRDGGHPLQVRGQRDHLHRRRRGAAGILVGAARQRGNRRGDAPDVAALDRRRQIDARLAAAAVLELGDEIVDVAAIGGELHVQGLQLGARTARRRRRQRMHLGEAGLDDGDGAHEAAPGHLGRLGLRRAACRWDSCRRARRRRWPRPPAGGRPRRRRRRRDHRPPGLAAWRDPRPPRCWRPRRGSACAGRRTPPPRPP